MGCNFKVNRLKITRGRGVTGLKEGEYITWLTFWGRIVLKLILQGENTWKSDFNIIELLISKVRERYQISKSSNEVMVIRKFKSEAWVLKSSGKGFVRKLYRAWERGGAILKYIQSLYIQWIDTMGNIDMVYVQRSKVYVCKGGI